MSGMETSQDTYRYADHSVLLATRGCALSSDETSAVPEIKNGPPCSMYLHEGPSQTHTTITIEEAHEQPFELLRGQFPQSTDFGRIFGFSRRREPQPGFDPVTSMPVHDRDPYQPSSQLVPSGRIRTVRAIQNCRVRVWPGHLGIEKGRHLSEMILILIRKNDHELPGCGDVSVCKEEAEPIPGFGNIIQKRFQRTYATSSRGWGDGDSHLLGLLPDATNGSAGKRFNDPIMARNRPHPTDDVLFHLRIG